MSGVELEPLLKMKPKNPMQRVQSCVGDPQVIKYIDKMVTLTYNLKG